MERLSHAVGAAKPSALRASVTCMAPRGVRAERLSAPCMAHTWPITETGPHGSPLAGIDAGRPNASLTQSEPRSRLR